MNTSKILTDVSNAAKIIDFNDDDRIVLISDCHRGDGSRTDDFLKNQNIYFSSLKHYYENNFTYIELGDGDELWDNNEISDIINAHKDVFWMLSRFYNDDRLYMLYGNHDMVKRNKKYAKKNLFSYYDELLMKRIPLFEEITIHEGLILKHEKTGGEIFLLHGHQTDFINYKAWRLTRFLVRYLWKPLELFGMNDPTRCAKNYDKKEAVDKRLIKWTEDNDKILIAGHTHRPMFPVIDEAPYFNDGSCVHPRCITAIEIKGGSIILVKWCVKTRESDALFIGREILAGPVKLGRIFL